MCLALYTVVSIASLHLNASREFNDLNPGLGLGCAVSRNWSYEGGVFANSYGDTSLYAIAIYSREFGRLELGAFAGTARYPDAAANIALPNIENWIPVAGLQARYGPFILRLLPQDGVYSDAVVSLQIRKDF